MRILSVLFALCFTHLSFSQEISTGIGLFMNGTNFKSDVSFNTQAGFATGSTSPWLGMNLRLVDKADLQSNISWYNQVNESMTYAGYQYRYSFLTIHNNVVYKLTDLFYAGAGIPLNFTTQATQSTSFGSIDLLEEGNAPGMLYGYNILVGYRNEISERSTLYMDVTRSHFLNSLDKDPDQKLTAKSYVFSIKMAFSL
jgi:hypothetical protein